MTENKKQYDPAEKVERLNRIFDQVVLPIIIFTVVMAIISSFIIKPESCIGSCSDNLTPVEEVRSEPDPYLMREVLLEDMESNRGIFEQGGYTVVETEQSGLVAHRQLDEHTDLFDNIADSSGNRYSAVVHVNDEYSVTVRIYSDRIFLVEFESDDSALSAVFRDDMFAQWTSGSDADAQSILKVVPSDKLSGLVEKYKQSLISLVEPE